MPTPRPLEPPCNATPTGLQTRVRGAAEVGATRGASASAAARIASVVAVRARINDVARGRVTIGNASRDRLPADPGGLTFNPIARDAVCVITHPSNSIGSLSQAQIQDIFSGSVRSWDDIPGAKASGAIDIVTRTASSGTADAFTSIFMGQSRRIAANAAAKPTNGLVQQTVASNKNAIGFVSLDFVAGTHPLGYKSVACNLRNAKSGQYGGVRTFYMVTRGAAKGPAAAFLRWVKSSRPARTAIASDWIPLR
jgi:phosphate transport system substrate-binding protein